MRYAVSVVSPPNYPHSAVFAEVAETLYHGLRALGHDTVLTKRTALPGRRHIVLGANLLPHFPSPLAEDAIIYNLEQVDAESGWLTPELLDIYRRHVVWDYSELNARRLSGLGVPVSHVLPIGYTEELSRIELHPNPDIDVLFVGSINIRRKQVLEQMRAGGLSVHTAFSVYGEERDRLIARSRLVLNVHLYEAKVLEMVRISYLLANRCVVLSEDSAEQGQDEALSAGVAFAGYADLPHRAVELIALPDERARLAARGFSLIRERHITEYLRPLVGIDMAAQA
jgi:hypothetical protein